MRRRHLLIPILSAILLAIPAKAAEVNPDSIKVDKLNWLYFGWIEDHPKAISVMGGGLYPRRPKLAKQDDHSWGTSKEAWHKDSDKPLFFMLSVDGGEAFYPDEMSPTRRQDIKWSLAEGSLPFPESEWEHCGVTAKITHVGRRLLGNSVNAVYTDVCLTNTSGATKTVFVTVAGKSASERCFFLGKGKYAPVKLKAGRSVHFSFVSPANGSASKEDILKQGSFEDNYAAEKSLIENKMSGLTMPVELPDPRYIDLWKSSMTHMWNATVKTAEDMEQRGSGGNIHGFYQYDRTFDHDVPDMTIQYIIEGNWDLAKDIMAGATYKRLSSGYLEKEAYLDAIPKYLITFAQYLQLSGDISMFNKEKLEDLKKCARAVSAMRDYSDVAKKMGVEGLIKKGSTLDNNKKTYVIVDDFAALHGFAAYKYICDRFSDKKESEWAYEQMKDLNDCLNAALRKSMEMGGIDWYNACLSFDMDYNLVAGPGNWLGTSFMMPTFPWNAQLKGFDLGGEWLDHLDKSVEVWLEVGKFYHAAPNMFGAWWGAKYGAAYDTGMAMQLLASDKYRILVKRSIDALLDNQTAPLIWGESFHKPDHEGDWTRPEVDLETWALGFIRQAMLQMCVSVKTNGDVIIGRGIPDEWVLSGKPIAWQKVRINNGKAINLNINKNGKAIVIRIDGDVNEGNFIVDIPFCKDKIQNVNAEGGKVIGFDSSTGKATVSGDSRTITLTLE